MSRSPPMKAIEKIAVERGGMAQEKVFVVALGAGYQPDQGRSAEPGLPQRPAVPGRLCRVMGRSGGHRPAARIGRSHRPYARAPGQSSSASSRRAEPRFAKAMSAKLGLENYVTFLGRAPDQELFEVLSTAMSA